MRSRPSHRSLALAFCLGLLASHPAHAVKNGDFEGVPNTSWLTDGPNAVRMAQGDGPSIRVAPNGNRYGHLGDVDGIGRDGENFTRVFQWFACQDSVTMGGIHCEVSFRFRTLLLAGELAWVRMKSAQQQRVWSIPHSNNQWAAGRRRIVLPNECQGRIFLEFGMIKQAGGKIGGRLNIDDVQHRCTVGAPGAPPGGNWNFLPGVPERDSSRVIPQDRITLIPYEGGNLTIVALVLAGVVLIVMRLRRA